MVAMAAMVARHSSMDVAVAVARAEARARTATVATVATVVPDD
jgi:hypothetical protein